ncbi:5-methylcytosine-specific restriction enzyme subunit McrC [Paenibacillus sp. V4I9]|uniref:5-methylcytosine-specific restriction endonuclease system specificity protein McrC n=1 Tax=Paenibacillus sp. V4I9 TaxID=3042308 RepID=UPI0027834778|nr:5-methylcytosine-specific restriction endonuclease system specificity protein McrC [Paenibacillus sp. V4I9]MDQ0884991.1 5-methylcytosine-specific restriction enzyme subunit McrC [Paenibacillus sp. V4I9]
MNEPNKIPIRNLYYMLCYAWDRLKEKDEVTVNQEEDKDIYHLLTRILIIRLTALMKKGFYREYKPFHEESSTLRGKIDFPQSIRELSFHRSKMVITYDELSPNILHNQIIKSTLFALLKTKDLSVSYREQIMMIYPYLGDVSLLKLDYKLFQRVTLQRGNMHYGFILNICKLLYQGLLINEDEGSYRFIDFERNHYKMAQLFEEFVRNFYRKELLTYKVSSDIIHWDVDDNDHSFLPVMKTDISLESETVKWIIDTKYSIETLSRHYDTEKVKSANLYQLYAYLRNYERKLPQSKLLKGMLLYPKVDQSVDLVYRVSGHEVKVCTVDLSKNWRSIHERLLEIIV